MSHTPPPLRAAARRLMVLATTAASLTLICVPYASADTINFEGILDGTPLVNQYSGVTFTNATVLTAGLSLNEFEFPPVSGTNVVFDDSGPMQLAFVSPLVSFSGFFTYVSPLTMTFYGAGNTVLGVVHSGFSNNTALSGVPGSAPNELLSFSSASGIDAVQILGDPAGGSFTADDFTLTAPATAAPEPAMILPVGAIVLVLAIRRRSA